MKRLLCFILIFLLLTPAVLADEQKMVFRLEEAEGKVGDTVTMNAVVENAPACASFRVIFTYDEEVLQPVSVKKVDCGGLFMSNTDFTYQGKAAINILSAHANKAFEGNVTLFTVTFKILAESPETTGSPISLAHREFFDPSTPKPQPITPKIELGVVYVGDDKPAGTTPDAPNGGETKPENPAPDTPTINPDTPTTNPDTPSTNPDTPVTNPDTPVTNPDTPTTNPDTNETPEIAPDTNETPDAPSTNEDKKPTGSWVPDKDTDDLYHVDEEGNSTVFQPEFSEKPEPGKVTDVILKDKETGKEVGSLKVEGNEDGTYDVIEQDVPSLNKPEEETPEAPESDVSAENENVDEEPGVNPDGISIWVWIGIGAGALAIAGAAVWYFLIFRKK